MDIWATRDTHEREEDEAERLVRPAPKVKPPRRDLRREDTQTDSDPDVRQDKDTSRDPDISVNYKNVGGSVGARVALRFALDGGADKVKVKKKDTGTTTYVSPETLKEKGGEYEAVEDEGEASPSKPESKSEAPAEPRPGAQHVEALRAKMQSDPGTKAMVDLATDPKSELAQILTHLDAKYDIRKVRGFEKYVPDEIKTVGEYLAAASAASAQAKAEKKQKPKKEPKPKAEKPAPKAPVEAPKEPEAAPAPKEPEADFLEDKDVKEVPAPPPVPKKGPAPTPAKPEAAPAQPAETPAAEPKKAPEKPSKKPPKEKAPEPEAAPKAPEPPAIPEPKRRKVTPQEVKEAKSLLLHNVPPDVYARTYHMHPDDIRDLVREYKSGQAVKPPPDKIGQIAEDASKFYQTDPAKVGPPKMWPKDGTWVPFEVLTPEEQGEALRKHQIQTVARSLVAQHQIASAIQKETKAPGKTAKKIATFMLTKPATETPEARNERATKLSQDVFAVSTAAGGKPEKFDPETVDAIFRTTAKDPAARKLAVAYLQANDYKLARQRFLADEKSPDRVTEFDPPKKIARGIQKAVDFLKEQAKRYPEDAVTQNAALAFRSRALDKLQLEDPEKHAEVAHQFDLLDADEYDAQMKAHQKALAAWQKKLDARKGSPEWKAYETAKATFDKDVEDYTRAVEDAKMAHPISPYRDLYRPEETAGLPPKPKAPVPPPMPPKPKEPVKPVAYDVIRAGGKYDDLQDKQDEATEHQLKALGHAKAARVLDRYFRDSTCTTRKSMDRTSVYNGVEPYRDTQPYVGWTQIQARDIGDEDLNSLVKAAREWLKAPVLSTAVEGIVRDTQLRAALDLAIRTHEDGRYSVGLHPDLYNGLIAKLAGVSDEDTLLTVREASVPGSLYAVVPAGDTPMPVAKNLRTYAAKIASQNPEIAFDLMQIAAQDDSEKSQAPAQGDGQAKQAGEMPPALKEHMEEKKEEKGESQQEQQVQASKYATLKAAVIRQASADPQAKQALMPLLKVIKQIG